MFRVSDNGRFLLRNDQPFFYLADTAWELFHRLSRSEADQYLQNRAAKRFNVVQAVVLAELDGLHTPNANGDLPLLDDDPARPNEAYFAHVDWIIDRAAELGIVTGLLPTWGDKVVPMWGTGPVVFTPANAFAFGQFLGQRYRDRPIIWILGGDRPSVRDDWDVRPVWRAMAQGIDAGVGGPALKTYHPMGGMSSADELHQEPWLDFNMQQSGHGAGRDVPVWERIAADYDRAPTKPVLDGEPNYEDHPVSPWPTWNPANGHFRDYDVRKQSYRSVFAGGCGITYGHQAIWQMHTPAHHGANYVDQTWQEGLDRPGAAQMQHLRALIEGRPMLERVPDRSLLASDPGAGTDYVIATRAADGSYAMVYSSSGQPFTLDLPQLGNKTLRAHWFDPRTGTAQPADDVATTRAATFTPPSSGAEQDWVLVLDDAARGWGTPGQETA